MSTPIALPAQIPARRQHAAVAVVLLAAAPNAWVTLAAPAEVAGGRMGLWWAAYAAFLAAFVAELLISGRGSRAGRTGLIATVLLVCQTLLALYANWLVPTVIAGVATGGALLVVVAAALWRYPLWMAAAWIGVQHTVLLLIYLDAWPDSIAWVAGVAFAVFSGVMLSLERMAARERSLRLDLSRTLVTLSAARRGLEAGARDAERLRITRELHDVLGHHLVALSLRLEDAQHALPADVSDGAAAAVADSKQITRQLLADLRAVVSDLRDGASPALADALTGLADEGPPRVEVEIAPGASGALALTKDAQTALLRCAQELVTNARKHAGATLIRIRLDADGLTVRDDGRGGEIREGFGIRGMRERLASFGGVLTYEPGGVGTTARVALPARSGAAP